MKFECKTCGTVIEIEPSTDMSGAYQMEERKTLLDKFDAQHKVCRNVAVPSLIGKKAEDGRP